MENSIHSNCVGSYGPHKRLITECNAGHGQPCPGGTGCPRAAAKGIGGPCALGGTRGYRACIVSSQNTIPNNCNCKTPEATSAVGLTGFPKVSFATSVFTGIVKKSTDSEAKETFCLYSALLVLKFLALYPFLVMVMGQSNDSSLHYQDLKFLTPFWLSAALFVTTQPNPSLLKWLMRFFFISRLLIVYNNLFCDNPIPQRVVDGAVYITHAISAFMILAVMFHYAKAW